jgi:hypothetical protein
MKKYELYPPPQWWQKIGLAVPEPEYRFHDKRRWRFDYYFPDYKVAIEIEGGVFQYGRHNRISGFIKDMEKYNAAAEMGILLLRYQSVQKMDVAQIKRTLSKGGVWMVNSGLQ